MYTGEGNAGDEMQRVTDSVVRWCLDKESLTRLMESKSTGVFLVLERVRARSGICMVVERWKLALLLRNFWTGRRRWMVGFLWV